MSGKHPARFHDEAIKLAAPYLSNCEAIIDPFAGVGRVFELEGYWGLNAEIHAIEIEPDWEDIDERVQIGDSTKLTSLFYDDSFDGVFTSPTYGNRMADHHDAKDGSRRITYKHRIGHDLNPNNSGRMQWGEGYKALHTLVYSQLKAVCVDGAVGVFNIKNHIRGGKEMPVVEWHIGCLASFGWRLRDVERLDTPGMRQGENYELRVEADLLIVMELEK